MGFLSQAQTTPAGFSKGSVFSAIPIQGQVRVICNGFNGTGTAQYVCRDVVLAPQAYDVFVGPKDARSKKVDLSCTREDGSVRARGSNYDGAKGRSADSFNLWISTIFQKPLLAYGKNKVSYSLKDDKGTVTATGSFDVTVNKVALRECPLATYNSTDLNDCASQYSVCQRYFEEYHYCQ